MYSSFCSAHEMLTFQASGHANCLLSSVRHAYVLFHKHSALQEFPPLSVYTFTYPSSSCLLTPCHLVSPPHPAEEGGSVDGDRTVPAAVPAAVAGGPALRGPVHGGGHRQLRCRRLWLILLGHPPRGGLQPQLSLPARRVSGVFLPGGYTL